MNEIFTKIGGYIASGDAMVNHDNTLSGNGTVASPLSVVPGYNETVLWSGNFTAHGDIELSGSMFDYDRINLYVGSNNNNDNSIVVTCWPETAARFSVNILAGEGNAWLQTRQCSANSDGTIFSVISAKNINFGPYNTTTTIMTANNTVGDACSFKKIVGINRKAQ